MNDGALRDARRHVAVVVIGAGHAGLAMSYWLSRRGVDHIVLERGEVAHTWKTERWDSLRLLTPNWQSRLPGSSHEEQDPDGFRTMPETVAFLEAYARQVAPPLYTRTRVDAVRPASRGYEVDTDQGSWACDAVVLATGACNRPAIPAVAAALPAGIESVSPLQYRNPDALPEGGVLVVGASASGVQLAEELQAAGRQVTLCVGEHVRVPRTYRGRDIQWWMDATGLMDQRYEELDDLERARNVASLQLAGNPDRRPVDINALSAQGVRVAGRLVGVSQGKLQFSGSLRNVCELADLKLVRLLKSIDEWATARGMNGALPAAERPSPTHVEASPPLILDLARSGIQSVLWATGFRPDYRWLQVPVLDAKGRILHDGGVVRAPGLYVLGLPFLRRRKSTLIDGAGGDAEELSAHLLTHLASAARAVQGA